MKRVVQVKIGQPGQQGASTSELHVDFQVSHRLGLEPSTAVITIQNPRSGMVGEARKPGALVELIAGHEGDARTIFLGQVIPSGAHLERSPTGRALTLHASDGALELAGAYASRSFGTVLVSDALAELAEDIGVGVAAIEVGNDIELGGLVLSGSASEHLDRLCALTGSAWAIRDRELYVWSATRYTEEVAPVYSVANKTLVGSPVQRDGGEVEVTVLLDAGMRPGRRFVIGDDASISGTFVASAVDMFGSNYGPAFYTKPIGTPIEQRLPMPSVLSNRRGSSPSTATTAKLAARQELAARWVSLPGVVVSYDASTRRARVRPGVRGQRVVDGVLEHVDPPELPDVPVLWPACSAGAMVGHLAAGDEVLVVVADRAIDNWKAEGGLVDAGDVRRSDPSDAMCFPVVTSDAQRLPASASRSGAWVLSGDDIRLVSADAGDEVATDSRVRREIDALWSYLRSLTTHVIGHTHPFVNGAVVVSAPPYVPNYPAVQSVGTPKVKAP